jgi:hypothetical protein
MAASSTLGRIIGFALVVVDANTSRILLEVPDFRSVDSVERGVLEPIQQQIYRLWIGRFTMIESNADFAAKHNSAYIEFQADKPKPRTEVWRVLSRVSGAQLGVIQWFPTWRQYCFMITFDDDMKETVFSAGYLQTITQCIQGLERRRTERNGPLSV